jgi:transcriptional antiterminator RfaH
MDGLKSVDAPCWYAIHTKRKQEHRIHMSLGVLRVETFFPQVRERQRDSFTEKVSYVVKPLFPNYLFARFSVSELLHKIKYTRGVHSVLSYGGRPTSIDDEIIEVMKSRLGSDGLVRLGEDLNKGDRVVIRKGPLSDFEGIFEGQYDAQERVSIFLTTVSYQNRVVIERDMLRKVG